MALVTFKTAELAKKRGYMPVSLEWVYTRSKDGTVYIENGKSKARYVGTFNEVDDNGEPLELIAAPDFEDLRDWLEKKGFYINIIYDLYPDGVNVNWQVLWYLPKEEWVTDRTGNGMTMHHQYMSGTSQYGDNHEFPTYDEAMDAALRKAVYKTKRICQYEDISHLAKIYKMQNTDMIDLLKSNEAEIGQWSWFELTEKQLDFVVSKLGEPKFVA
jgi:hypothetical protein